jgi:hypothetical protein
MMDGVAAWLKGTALSNAIVTHIWVWPLCESLHFIGLALVIGIVGFMDLRLMGFMKRVPLGAIRDLMPLAILGFTLNLVTGALFFIGTPEQYVHNIAWWAKVCFLIVAGVNAAAYEATIGATMARLADGADTPLGAKVIGAVSLVSWLGVLYWGRMLPFIGNSF